MSNDIIRDVEAAPHYIGHRNRMKEKLLSSDVAILQDYEILELMLFSTIPRRDVRPIAKELIRKFGSLTGVIHADIEKLTEIKWMNNSAALAVKSVKELIKRILKEQIIDKNVISSWSDLLDYLRFNMGALKIEQFRILFMNKKNILICDEVMATGTIDQTAVYPREVVKKSLYHDASSIILVHNHPSGNTKPSNADIDLTTEIIKACKTINVTVHDHVIVGNNDCYSFKTHGLI